jgi:hypothetical protein
MTDEKYKFPMPLKIIAFNGNDRIIMTPMADFAIEIFI